MKSLNFLEIQSIVEMIHDTISGSPLQDVYCVDEKLSFGFYKNHFVHWVIIDLSPAWPFIGLFKEPYKAGPKTVKPVVLFIQSRFKNRILKSVQIEGESERVVRFIFDEDSLWEFRAIPKQVNLICWNEGKSISWNKVQQTQTEHAKSIQPFAEQFEVRSIASIFSFWQRMNVKFEKNGEGTSTISIFDKWKKQKEKDVQKKTQALEKLKLQVHNPLVQIYTSIGEHLKVHGYKNLDLEWPRYIDMKARVADNIEFCFQKSKQLRSKGSGAQKRMDILQGEINQLKDLSQQAFEQDIEVKRQRLQRPQTALKDNLKIQTRKKVIDESLDINCYMGKSAQENVKLLKSAKPWFIWLHLKDYPSAYALLFYGKNVKLSDKHIRDAATWLVEESFKNEKGSSGYKVKVVFTECRYVKLVKGDRLGRVTYSLAKELVISL